MMTGYVPRIEINDNLTPSCGSVVARMRGANAPRMPAYVCLPNPPPSANAAYLGVACNPFSPGSDPNSSGFQVRDLRLAPRVDLDRFKNRRDLLKGIDKLRRDVDIQGNAEGYDRFYQEAFEIVTGEACRNAFDIHKEAPRLRDRYGRDSWGQSTLLARRLVESGVTWVTAVYHGWDHHWDLEAGLNSFLPMVDNAFASLLSDLEERGLLGRTLVVMCGEFGRTPKMNDGGNGGRPRSMGTPGRDHWGAAMFCVFAGGGLRQGVVVGSTDRLGTRPKDRPVTPGDIHATIY